MKRNAGQGLAGACQESQPGQNENELHGMCALTQK
jgi:hypothetical protein